MSDYQKKKPHIDAYRRREKAKRCFKKLNEIVSDSNEKDCEKIQALLNNLWWRIKEDKQHIDDFLPKGGEVNDKHVQENKRKMVQPIPQYFCPECRKLGYLYSPELDLTHNKMPVYILHFFWDTKDFYICQLPPLKRDLVYIVKPSEEGFFTFT